MERLIFATPERVGGPRSKAELFPDSVFDDIDVDFGEGEGTDRGYFVDVTPDVIWPVKQCVALRKSDHLQVVAMKTAKPVQMRGRVRILPKYSAWLYHAHYSDDGSVSKERLPVGFLGGEWRMLDAGMEFSTGARTYIKRAHNVTYHDEIRSSCAAMMSGELTNRYEWSVSFRIDTSPSLRLFTDPTGIRALFKDRERGNRPRRASLRHWVSEHYRRKRLDAEAEIFVREHLRGSERFLWSGYDCTVHVAPYDLERADHAAQKKRAAEAAPSRARS